MVIAFLHGQHPSYERNRNDSLHSAAVSSALWQQNTCFAIEDIFLLEIQKVSRSTFTLHAKKEERAATAGRC